MKFKYFFVIILFTSKVSFSQKIEIGIDYGRAYFFYRYKDYGEGFINEPKSNYGFIAGISIQKQISNYNFLETGLRFALYKQYYSTRRHWGAWEQNYSIIQIPALFGIQSNKKLGYKFSGGMILGFMPDQYEAPYIANYHPDFVTIDSITRGTMKRNFTPIFPMINFNAALTYKFKSNLIAELKAGYGKGFLNVTEYDIYYNDGSGKNDKQAKQWGKGDFASLNFGIKYVFKNKDLR